MVKANIEKIKENISLICKKTARNPQDITIVAVTKFASPPMVEEALACGITHIGENRVQAAARQFAEVKFPPRPIIKHMIGHLQTNKAKDALALFDIIQSVDSLKLVQALDRQAAQINRKVDILVQVNISGETQKFGVARDEGMALVGAAAELKHIRILGLMTIAPLSADPHIARDCFKGLRQLRDDVARDFKGRENVQMKFLSMGMSDDYPVAIEEGSNMVRIGRAIFSDA